MVILWLVSANFRSAAANVSHASGNLAAPGRYGGGLLGAVMGGMVVAAAAKNAANGNDAEAFEEAENLLVMQDEKGRSKPREVARASGSPCPDERWK